MSFVCHSFGDTLWYFQENKTLPTKEPTWYGNRVIISEANITHSGYYYCYGLYSDLKNHFLAMSRLKIYSKLFYDVLRHLHYNRNSCI